MAILAAALVIRLPFALGGLIDYDEGVYWQSLRSMSAGNALYSHVYSSQPPAFLLGLSPLYALLGHSFSGARLAIVAWSLMAIVAAFSAGKSLVGERAGLYAAALIAVDPILLRESVVVQAEGPAIALGLVAVALAARARGGGERSDGMAVLAGAAVTLGVLTKVVDVAVAVPVAVLLTARGTEGVGLWRRRTVAACAGAVLVAAAVLLPLAGRWQDMFDQAVGLHVSSRALDEGGWSAEMLQAAVREAPMLVIGAIGIDLLRRRVPLAAVMLASWVVLSVAALAFVHPLWPHHLSSVIPPLALAGGAAADALLQRGRTAAQLGATALAIASLLAAAGDELRVLHTPERQSASDATVVALAALTKDGDLIVTDDQYALARAGRDTPARLVDTSVVRIASQPLTLAAVEDIIVQSGARGVFFATSRLDHLPGLRDWVGARFVDVHRFSDGTVLYLRAQRTRPH